MKKPGILVAFLVVVLLAAARFGATGLILAAPAPYGARVVSALGAMLAVALAILLDQLIRGLYWDGFLHRRLKRETPTVIKGLLTIAIVALGASVGLFFEEGVSFAGVLTASGAAAFVLGIALQAPINDVFSGVSVNLDDAFAIGDWLTIYSEHFPEPIYGRVQGITWRTTFLRLCDGRRLLIPNHALTTNPVMNHSRPPGPKRLSVQIPVAFHFPADRAMAILLGEAYRAVRTKPLVAHREPDIQIERIESDSVVFQVRFYAELDETDPDVPRSIMAHALYSALLRHKVPNPATQVELVKGMEESHDVKGEAREALGNAAIFENVLDAAQLDTLIGGCDVRTFLPGAVFIKQAEAGSSMFVLLEGAARVSITMADGHHREVAVLTAGDIVGEMSLMTGAPRTASVTALTAMRVLEVTKASIETLLAKESGLMERLSYVLAQRQLGLSEIANNAVQTQALERDILAQMRRFFSRAFR
ncbi:MAG TPA: mechanosensitive ion channel family protein [Rhizomicrobium sp.]|nr:mechanosensitive ion channel family protein [Rhizomicrobium sp.]